MRIGSNDDFRKAWPKAWKAVGLEAVMVHDLRRSCARNLVRAGVPERIAMNFTGHKDYYKAGQKWTVDANSK